MATSSAPDPTPQLTHIAAATAGVAAAAVVVSLLVPTAATTADPRPVAVIPTSKPSLITVTQDPCTVVTAARESSPAARTP